MRRIYSITFYLCFGALLLGLPQAYSASQDSLRKNISRKYFHVFQTAMQVYQKRRLSKSAYQFSALKEIKSYVELSPKAYECIALCYIHYNFDKAHNDIFPKQLILMISSFIKPIEDESYYQQRRKMIVEWGFDY